MDMTTRWVPAGAGGGGKDEGQSNRAAREAADSLRSKAFARIIDLLSEGEIVGLVDGFKSIYLNDTPIQAQDGTFNFQNVSIVTRPGTQSQGFIPGFPATENAFAVNTQVLAAVPVTRTISSADCNFVLVTIGIPQLFQQDTSNGDINGSSVQIAIDLQSNGGGFVEQYNQAIIGKTTSRYQRTVRIELTGSPPWDIRVRRITADSILSTLQNRTDWDSYTEGIDGRLKYPNSALVGFSIDAEQFSGVPTRGYEIKGVLVKIPSNYDPVTRIYTGIWDGTFTVAWTNNPAWCWYDLVTNTRYGLGNYIDATKVDKWSLFTIGQYCDELVPDGFGGMEPRFTCNLYLQTQDEAIRVIQTMASVFRGMVYWAGGQLVPVQDAPGSAAHIFTAANVKDGLFTYSGSSRRARHTVALVEWNDPDDLSRRKVEYVEDLPGVAKAGVVETSTIAVGCSSRGQAHRVGAWTLLTERLETEIVTFATAFEGLSVRPGQLFKVLDPDRAAKRLGGRIAAATTTQITVDSNVVIEGGKSYTIDVKLPDGTVQNRSITNTAGTYTVLNLGSALSQTPQVQAVWVITVSDLSPQTFRCLSVAEKEDNWVEIIGLEHVVGKYATVDAGVPLAPLPTFTSLTPTPAPPTALVLSDFIRVMGSGDIQTVLVASWTPPADLSYGIRYLVEFRKSDGNWLPVPGISTTSNTVEVPGVSDGVTYDVRVTTINAGGVKSATSLAGSRTVVGKSAPPSDVISLSVAQQGALVLFVAATVPDPDLDLIEIRFGETTNTWDQATPVGNILRGREMTTAVLPPGTWKFFAKAKDTTGNYSTNAIEATATIANTFTAILSKNYAPDWLLGVKSNVVEHWTGVLTLESTKLASELEWEVFDQFVPFPYASGYYETPVIDKTVDAFARVWTDPVSLLGPGEVAGVADVRVSIDYKLNAGAFDGFEDWSIGTINFRQLKARVTLDTSIGNIVLSGFTVTVDNLVRTEKAENVSVAAGGTPITFSQPFHVAPNLQVTAQGGTARIPGHQSLTTLGATIRLFDTTGAGASGTADWVATGV
jgi:predicted phage tail protein